MLEEEERIGYLKNIEFFKNKIKKKDLDNIDDWSSFKKKIQIIENKNNIKKKINKIKILNNKVIIKIIEKLKYKDKKNENIKNKLNYFENKSINFFTLINTYKKINLNKFFLIKKLRYYKISNKNIFIILDARKLKTKIIAFNAKKCLITLSNGLMFKKMKLKNKKYIKSEKLSYLTIKTFMNKINYLEKRLNVFLYVKGYKNNINSLIKYINNKFIKKNSNSTKFVIINSYKKSNNKFFGFKKIKAIKRNLKKKIIKFSKKNN